MTVILGVIFGIHKFYVGVHIRCFYNLCEISGFGLGLTIFFRPLPQPHFSLQASLTSLFISC